MPQKANSFSTSSYTTLFTHGKCEFPRHVGSSIWMLQIWSPSLVHGIIVVKPVIVFKHLSLDLGSIDPRDKVLQISGDKIRRIGDYVGTHSNVSLLYVCHGLFQVLREFQLHQNTRKPASTTTKTQDF